VSRRAKALASIGGSPSAIRARSSNRKYPVPRLLAFGRMRQRRDGGVARIDLQHRLAQRASLSVLGEQLRQPAIQPMFPARSDRPRFRAAASRRATSSTCSLRASFSFVTSVATSAPASGVGGSGAVFLLRHEANVGGALRHRFEWLAVEADATRHPKGVDGIVEQQHLHVPRREFLDLRAPRHSLAIVATR